MKYTRKGKIITGPNGNKIFASINAAKRESARIQQANGGLGRGSLSVVPHKPLMPQRQFFNYGRPS